VTWAVIRRVTVLRVCRSGVCGTLAQAQPAGLRIELDRADEADHDGHQDDVEDREPFGIGGL
jgi:hypothetical protein